MLKKLFIMFFTCLFLITGCTKENNSVTDTNNYGTITGKITDISTGHRINGATIQTNPATSTAASNVEGYYTLTNVSPGRYQITASKENYITSSVTIDVSSGSSTTADISLSPENNIIIAPVLISPANGLADSPAALSFSWSASENALSYTLQISTSSTFTDTLYNLNGIHLTYSPAIALDYAKTYYWRVCANNNSAASNWSDIWSFSTIQFSCGLKVSYMNKDYNTVQIGTQCWFKENLDAGSMVQGTIPSDNEKIEKYCYDNQLMNCNTYGGLYLWNEAMNYSLEPGAKGICPEGWHIPAKEEFEILITAVNNQGNALKALGVGIEEGIGTNTSGFSALLPGHGHVSETFSEFGWTSFMWSSTIYQLPNINYLQLFVNDNSVTIPYEQRTMAFSVRCLKD